MTIALRKQREAEELGHTYLYTVIENPREAFLGIRGVDGTSPVRIVASDGLGCVVSDYRGEEFATLPREKLVQSLLAHQQVVEHAMQQYTVLPVKFGTLLDNPHEAIDLLFQGRPEFLDALAAIRNKVELDLGATWDTARVLQEISNGEEVVQAREAIARKGQPTLEERVHLGRVVKACMDRRRDSYRERMVSFLKPLAVDVTPNILVSDEMVMNVAFLVEQARHCEFDARVHQLDKLFQGEITFRVLGPLPPYSFNTLEITKLTPEQVEEARQLLNLEGDVSESEVRKAYRRLAAAEQRNMRSGDKLPRSPFARLGQAKDLLLHYCRPQSNAQKGGHHGSAGQGIQSLFAVAIQRSRRDEVEPARFGSFEEVLQV